MSSILLRLCLLTFVCAGLTAAAPWLTCPNSASTDLYQAGSDCAAFRTCVTNYCSCAGATSANTTTGLCIWGTTRPNCSLAHTCVTNFIDCADDAAADSTCANATSLAALKIGILNLAGGSFYNGSSIEKACQLHTCKLFNSSVTEASCTNISYSTICAPAFVFTGTLVLSGNWTAILADPVKKAAMIVTLTAVLSEVLGLPVTIISITSGSLIIVFTVPVAAGNAALQQNLATAGSSATWLAAAQAAYTAAGGTGTLTVTSIGASTTAPPTTVATTPVPGATTAAPGGTPAPGAASATSIVVGLISAFLLAALMI